MPTENELYQRYLQQIRENPNAQNQASIELFTGLANSRPAQQKFSDSPHTVYARNAPPAPGYTGGPRETVTEQQGGGVVTRQVPSYGREQPTPGSAPPPPGQQQPQTPPQTQEQQFRNISGGAPASEFTLQHGLSKTTREEFLPPTQKQQEFLQQAPPAKKNTFESYWGRTPFFDEQTNKPNIYFDKSLNISNEPLIYKSPKYGTMTNKDQLGINAAKADFKQASDMVAGREAQYKKNDIFGSSYLTPAAETLTRGELLGPKINEIYYGVFGTPQEKTLSSEQFTMARAAYYSNLPKNPTPQDVLTGVVTSLPAQAYIGGAIFKGATLGTRIALEGAGAGLGDAGIPYIKSVASALAGGAEPAAVIGGMGYSGFKIVTSPEKQIPGEVGVSLASIPFAYAGWRDVGKGYSQLLQLGKTEVPSPINPEVLSGEKQFPTTPPGMKPTEFIKQFERKPFFTNTEASAPADVWGADYIKGVKQPPPKYFESDYETVKVESITPAKVWGGKINPAAAAAGAGGYFGYHASDKPLGPEAIVQNAPTRGSDIGGLYMSPERMGASGYFLRLDRGTPSFEDYVKGLFSSEPLNPTVHNIEIGGVERLPTPVRSNVQLAREFIGSEFAEQGKAYLTPKLETGLKTGAEAEATLTPGTKITRTSSNEFFDYKGYKVALDRYTSEFGEIAKAANPSRQIAAGNNDFYYRSPFSIPVKQFFPEIGRTKATSGYKTASSKNIIKLDDYSYNPNDYTIDYRPKGARRDIYNPETPSYYTAGTSYRAPDYTPKIRPSDYTPEIPEYRAPSGYRAGYNPRNYELYNPAAQGPRYIPGYNIYPADTLIKPPFVPMLEGEYKSKAKGKQPKIKDVFAWTVRNPMLSLSDLGMPVPARKSKKKNKRRAKK